MHAYARICVHMRAESRSCVHMHAYACKGTHAYSCTCTHMHATARKFACIFMNCIHSFNKKQRNEGLGNDMAGGERNPRAILTAN